MTTPPFTCQRCGSFGATMAELQEICHGHAPVLARGPDEWASCLGPDVAEEPIVASWLDIWRRAPPSVGERQVLAHMVRELVAEMQKARLELTLRACGARPPAAVVLVNPPPEVLSRQQEFLADVAASPSRPSFVGVSGRPFVPFVTTPPAPKEETVRFFVKTPDEPAPWGPLKVQFQALDAAGNVLASVPAGEQLDAPSGAVSYRYLIDRVEGGDELVISPSVGFWAPADAPAVGAEALAGASGPRLFAFSLVKEGGHPMQRVDIAAPDGALPMPSIGFLPGPDVGAAGAEDPPPSPEHEAALNLPGTSDVEEDLPHGATSVFTKEMLAAGRAALVPLEGLVALEMRVTRDDHEGRLLFHAADGELLEAAADGVPHAVPVGTDHVRLSVRRKA